MLQKGLLKFEEFGFSMPVTDPYVPGPTTWSRSGERFMISFEMDYDSVAHRLPEPLEFDGDVPHGALLCIRNPFITDSTPFLEAHLIYGVKYNGQLFNYVSNLFVSEVEALVAGREVYGYAKKMAHIDFYTDNGQICMTADRPKGFRIFSAAVRTRRPSQPNPDNRRDVLLLKVIPSPVKGAGPQVCQLVGLKTTNQPIVGSDGLMDYWECDGSISWGAVTKEDPWGETKITKITDAFYTHANTELPHGYIVYDYLNR